MSIPASMRAWQYSTTSGGIEKNLKLNTVPTSQPSSTQSLIRLIAVCLNPVDYKPAENPLVSSLAIKKPATPGIDVAGVVVKPAEGSKFKPGQVVFGTAGTGSPLAAGGLKEYVLIETKTTLPVPEGVDPIDAAASCVAGLTAYQSIVPYVKPGDRVFINGGSGGTGIYGIQVAKAVGCNVTTTCSSRNVELCRSLGADEVIDYTKGDVIEALKKSKKIDYVVDNVGDFSLYWRCHEYTSEKAKFMQIAGEPSLHYFRQMTRAKYQPGFLGGGKRPILSMLANPQLDHMEKLVTWVQEGKIKTIIDEKFKFGDAPAAFAKLKTKRARGKIVVMGPE
jgi:NADPH:quinone reductase-like Zn-dependent oxidoreductase